MVCMICIIGAWIMKADQVQCSSILKWSIDKDF